MGVFKYSPLDFLFTCLGLLFLLLDIVLDILAVVAFYQEKAYLSLASLLLFLLGSSVLVQAFSWLWYSYDNFKRETRVEKSPSLTQLRLLHVLQLGIYLRHAGVVEISVCSFCTKRHDRHADFAVYLSHDLSMLRLVETFSESAPQLVLMLTITLQGKDFGPVPVLKAICSALAIAFSVTMYHRSLRSFLLDKQQQGLPSSAVYFIWNMLLISSRITALSLFASVLPCFIFPHFFCSWLIFLFFAWQSKTEFMSSPGGEWLYRATVSLIWYFNWFNVVEGRTRYSTVLYHGFILFDVSLLCSLSCWMMLSTEDCFETPNLNVIIFAVSVVAFYILGLFFKMLYYKCCHPNLTKEELKGDTEDKSQKTEGDETDSTERERGALNDSPVILRGFTEICGSHHALPSYPRDTKPCNARMRTLARNFYL